MRVIGHGLPVRLRLVLGFAVALLVLETAAGAFVFWRVQFALDRRLDDDLRSQAADLGKAAQRLPAAVALASLQGRARDAQVLDATGATIASGPGIAAGTALISPVEAATASRGELRIERGSVLSKRGRHTRLLATPVHGPDGAAVAVSGVILDQRDEALRELLAQLAIAGLVTLAIASYVGYRFARAALDPVERYRAQAEQIAGGATGVRLDVPPGPSDEITRLGTTLNAMLDALEDSVRRQQQLVDDASHELRTPIAALTAEIEIARRKPRTIAQHEATLQHLATGTRNLADLADTLLTLGTIGSTPLHAKPVYIGGLLEVAARRARGQLGDSPGRTVLAEPDGDTILDVDEHLLARALGNLVDNAVRHGTGTISLETHLHRTAAVITVHDQGTMEPAFLPHAVERFRRHETSRTGTGTGLGLSLVEAVVRAHEGQMRICSGGHHHHVASNATALDAVPCTHSDAGTTVSIVLASLIPAGRSSDLEPHPDHRARIDGPSHT